MCWVSGPCWLGCLRGWGLRTSLLRLTHFGAVSGGRPGEALRVSWSANSPSSPRLLVAKARAVRSAHRDCYLLLPPPAKQTRWGLSTLQEGISSRASRPLPVDLQLVGHGGGGFPPSAFPEEIWNVRSTRQARLCGPLTSHQKKREGRARSRTGHFQKASFSLRPTAWALGWGGP